MKSESGICCSGTLEAVKRASVSCCQSDLDIGLHNSCMECDMVVAQHFGFTEVCS